MLSPSGDAGSNPVWGRGSGIFGRELLHWDGQDRVRLHYLDDPSDECDEKSQSSVVRLSRVQY